MNLADLQKRAAAVWSAFENPQKPLVLVGDGTCGRAAGGAQLSEAIRDALEETHAGAEVVGVGCLGLCYAEPMMEIRSPGGPSVLYAELTPKAVGEIIAAHVGGGEPPASRALCVMQGETVGGLPRFEELPVTSSQERIVTRNCGRVDPSSLDHYVAGGGFGGLAKALELSPGEVISEVETAGLRGRGGAGFPTGRKWRFAREAPGDAKYLICNADEGDPGAFMDRALLESDPYAVLEGMVIASYAIGVREAYIYCRAEYPLAIERLDNAMAHMEEAGLLGDGILGTDFGLHVKIKQGAGAFVCGEETALIASMEGRRGMPRVRPPFPAQSGLFGKPSNINNVETFANVPPIIARGADWYRTNGTESSPGTKVFALAGKVERTGLVEVPMGLTLREIVFDVGGGIPNGKRFKAVQTGGPSGGCLPESCLDLPVDYDRLAEAGSIMGSGGMIVMDEDTCIPDIARYFVSFTKAESCGKCTPCRLGTWQMKEMLDKVCTGRAGEADLALLEEVAEVVRASSLCGLGQTAPNPVLTTLQYFGDEYAAHVRDGRCPAKVCPELLTYTVDAEACRGCLACLKVCPSAAITGERKKPHVIDQEKCSRCGSCYQVCKFEAVLVE